MSNLPLPTDDAFWGEAPADDPPTFAPAPDGTALLESLGSPPVPGGLAAFAAVYAEAARLAGLLARSADLLDDEAF